MRTTPTNITKLNPQEIFVFGSNEAGIHGAGAARQAFRDFGAIWGRGYGLQGQSFAVPTKNWNLLSLRVNEIEKYVKDFIDFARYNPLHTFLVTEIGCGLAGYTPAEIAPLFSDAKEVENIYLPQSFWEYI